MSRISEAKLNSSRVGSNAGAGGALQSDRLVRSLPVVLLHLLSAGTRMELSPGHLVPRGPHSAADSICSLYRWTLASHTCRSVIPRHDPYFYVKQYKLSDNFKGAGL